MSLTPRERAVLVLAQKGHPPREIADALGMKVPTASWYLQNLRKAGHPVPFFRQGRPPQVAVETSILSIPSSVLSGLQPDASRRGMEVGPFVCRLLDAIASDGLVDAILDDKGGRS